MGQGQPAGQMLGRLLRCHTVERHHGRRHAGRAPELRTPPVANRCDFDLIQAAADVVFEVMHVHVDWCWSEDGRRSYAAVSSGQAKPGAKALSTALVLTIDVDSS